MWLSTGLHPVVLPQAAWSSGEAGFWKDANFSISAVQKAWPGNAADEY
jgi:hypothetical protein